MNESPNNDEIGDPAELDVLHRYLLGQADPAEFERLQQDLLKSPELRKRFLRAVRVDAVLQEESLRRQEVPAAKVTPFPWRHLLAVAAAVVFVGLGWWWIDSIRGSAKSTNAEVATLIDARDCQWANGTHIAVEGRLIPRLLNLTSGVALIEFDGGARLALQGPASLEVSGSESARLRRGSATVRCEDGADGFSLLTPNSTVIDLGTEFGVSVEADGGTAVEVLDGAVEVEGASTQSPPSTRVLTAGETLKLDPDGSDRLAVGSGQGWVRDYSSQAERVASSKAPQLRAHDSFSPSGMPLRNYVGGDGWKGAWIRATKDWHAELYFAPAAPIIKRSQEQGDALVVGPTVEVRRTLAEPIDPSKPQRVYVGFSLHRLYPNMRDASGRLGDATLLLRASRDPAAFIGMAYSGLNRLASSDHGGWERSETELPGTSPYFVVARIDFRPQRGNQVAMVAFDDSVAIPAQEPKKWNIVTHRHMNRMTEKLDVVALRVGKLSAFKFGEISIGNSWQAVTNPAAVAK